MIEEDLWLKHKNTPLKDAIIARKKHLKDNIDHQKSFDHICSMMDNDINDIIKLQQHAVMDIDYQDIVNNKISDADKKLIKKRGACIIRNVFDRAQAQEWNDTIGDYIRDNDYTKYAREKVGLDQYFSALDQSAVQIYALYWSKPQIEARQSQQLANVRAFLNNLWSQQSGNFNFNQECSYADRLRRRPPKSASLGLSPHIDGGSVERWLDDSFFDVYCPIFTSDLENYNPFSADYRDKTYEIPSPAVCRMFRTYQGWTALTKQGAGDGTLNVIPSSLSIGYILLRALQDDVADDDLCGSLPGRALNINPEYHQFLIDALVPIPTVEAGDTVWWHPDVVHSVEDAHNGDGDSNVLYIGAAPDCAKNRAFLNIQKHAFLEGKSCPDFAAEDYEVHFTNRAKFDDLSDLGKIQMGFL